MKQSLPIVILPLLLAGCAQEIPLVSLGIDDVYYIERMKKLPLSPALTGKKYRWTVNGNEVSDRHDFIFLARDEGRYDVVL